MQKYSGKNLDQVLNDIALEKNVNVEDITYNIIEQSGFSVFSKIEIEAYTKQDCIDSIKKYICDVLKSMDFEVEVEIEENDEEYNVNINSNNNGLIIGVNGKNLYALETLTRQVISNMYKKRFYINLDVNGYFKEKEEKLKRFAYKIAAEVGKTKVEVKLDPMPNYDRKIIHKVLKEVHYVETKSYGEGKTRHLVVHYDKENDLKYNENK